MKDVGPFNDKKCSCIICACPCNERYRLKDHHSILLQEEIKNSHNKSVITTIQVSLLLYNYMIFIIINIISIYSIIYYIYNN